MTEGTREPNLKLHTTQAESVALLLNGTNSGFLHALRFMA